MQVDHGWEYRDVVGNWVTNDRFPHGLEWLSDELRRLDLKLGIWIAASCVSEHTPFYAEHPEALIRNADGTPKVFIDKWHWAPHGRVFSLDPTHPAAQQHYRDSFQPIVDEGVRYYKVDFIGSAGNTDGVFHDPKRPRGYPMLRYEMQQIRDVVGADSWLRYCSAPSNAYCGIVNIGGATMDIGNASGNWDHLRGYHQQLSSCWYKHRTFWHNEPDALIVGEGEENEARLRCAWLALSGGVVALGDDLTKIAPERAAMIPKCLPPYDVAARPLDLFESIPVQIWALTVNKPWGTHFVLGLFNLSEEEVTIPLSLERLGLEGRPVVGWEFWTQSLVNTTEGGLTVSVPANDSRIVMVREVQEHPQVIATDMHLTMGGVELSKVDWNPTERTLSGVAVRAPGEKGTIYVHVPKGYEPIEAGPLTRDRVLGFPVEFTQPQVTWSVAFRASGRAD
jgi:alpha-galactosidase